MGIGVRLFAGFERCHDPWCNESCAIRLAPASLFSTADGGNIRNLPRGQYR
jgi:hypothetical protein